MLAVLFVPCQTAPAPARQDFQLEGLELARAARWAELKSLCEERMSSTPSDPAAEVLMAYAELGLGAPQAALSRLAPILDSKAASPLAWWVSGLCHIHQGTFELAVEDARRLSDLHPDLAFELLQRPALLKHLGCEGPLPRRVIPNATRLDQPSAPTYPAGARNLGIHGDVVMDLILDAQGKPIAAKAIWGPPLLVPTAVDYAKTFTFKPILPTGGPVMLRISMPFRLVTGANYQAAPKQLLASDALERPSDSK